MKKISFRVVMGAKPKWPRMTAINEQKKGPAS
jgi:hypothetical protein